MATVQHTGRTPLARRGTVAMQPVTSPMAEKAMLPLRAIGTAPGGGPYLSVRSQRAASSDQSAQGEADSQQAALSLPQSPCAINQKRWGMATVNAHQAAAL